jgi:aspartyl-tRNA(Asn)/glutamyl-tRNA(Gln) amidotransferase subunit A
MTPKESLDRIRRYDGRLKAFVRVFDPPLDGDLAGGPTFGIKDLIDVAGVPTGGGAQVPVDPCPRRHAIVVERLLRAGWTAVGKTQTVELAFGAWGSNQAVGAPWNPWDASAQRAPGGSSSGSAAAVAAGLCDAALGTDTGGSVRIPAALCGVVGLKPGRGLVSLEGVHPLSPALDTVGAIARDVATAARMLAVISGPDGADAERGPFDAETALVRDVGGIRLAAAPPRHLGELEAEVTRLYFEALATLQRMGVEVEQVPPFRGLEESFAPNGVIMASEGWGCWRDRIAQHRSIMDPWIVRRFEAGRDVSEAQLAAARARRVADQAHFRAWIASYDGVVSPTCPITAPPLALVDESVSPLSRLTRTANYLDLPAISVPCGLSAAGLPVGLQIMGRPQDEPLVVAVAAAFERASVWDRRAPDLSGFSADLSSSRGG